MDFIGGVKNNSFNSGAFERIISAPIILNFYSTALVYRGLNNGVADLSTYQVPTGKKLLIKGFKVNGTISASAIVLLQIGSGTTVTNTSTAPTDSKSNLTQAYYLLQTANTEIISDCNCEVDAERYPYVRCSDTNGTLSGQLYCQLVDE